MPIEAVLPEGCEPRSAAAARFDGTAFVSEWVARCPGGLEGGEIRIEGLERTETDVLVRYELAPGVVESQRLTAATTAFVVPEPQGPLGVFATYGALGIDHILKGIDHLMFVFALLLLIRDRRRLIGAVTAFTVAHSLSLAAAALGWIVVPAPPVEKDGGGPRGRKGRVGGAHRGEGLAGEQDGDGGDQEALRGVGERMQQVSVERPEVAEGVVGGRGAGR